MFGQAWSPPCEGGRSHRNVACERPPGESRVLVEPPSGGACSQLQFKMMCDRPSRSLPSRLPLTRGRLKRLQRESFILPLVRGRAAEGGRGSLTSHTSRWATAPAAPGLHSAAAAPRL